MDSIAFGTRSSAKRSSKRRDTVVAAKNSSVELMDTLVAYFRERINHWREQRDEVGNPDAVHHITQLYILQGVFIGSEPLTRDAINKRLVAGICHWREQKRAGNALAISHLVEYEALMTALFGAK